ncbi:MAG: type II/IV secretion system protein [Gemmatimonadetes bacterium]|nr:type II/IV secretion system protein [Gemmatimonadota bacterium]
MNDRIDSFDSCANAPLVISPTFPKGPLEWPVILQWLLTDNLIDSEEAERIQADFDSTESSQHPMVRFGTAGLTDKRSGRPLATEALTAWLATKLDMPYLHIDPLKVDVACVTEAVPIRYAEKRHALPVKISPSEITVATYEPLDTDWVAEMEAHTKKRVRLVVSNPVLVRRFTREFYALAHSVRQADRSGGATPLASFQQLVELGRTSKYVDANDRGVVQVVDWLWQYAFDQRASDIHLEPGAEMGVIRFRIDGVLHTVYQVPSAVMTAMIARIKVLGHMDVSEKRRPLDGRIRTVRPGSDASGGGDMEMRLATLPTAFGEKMVMRLFDPTAAAKPVDALGFGAEDVRRWSELTRRPHGIILVTGPTGSGKTTTLYSTLKRIATDEVNVCTIEDPIEMIEPAFNQTQVHGALDLGFAEGLRALMRQDPDIIMVGEIRDLPTAEMAIRAALTGHLVFSTLHSNDAASALTRLADLGVAPFLISATVGGVLAQRLVRTLCPLCKEPDDSQAAKQRLRESLSPWTLTGEPRICKPVGCVDCRMTGYKGRAGLYELITMSEETSNYVHPTVREDLLRRQAVADGMRPLRAAGAMKVAEGVTTIEEVLRTTPPLSTGPRPTTHPGNQLRPYSRGRGSAKPSVSTRPLVSTLQAEPG